MKAAIYTLGCKVNLYESEFVIDLLKENHYEIVNFEEKADIYIINTCSVTNESDRKSRKIINRAKRQNNDAIIVVMGCYSQVKTEEIQADIILGNKDKSKIIELIEEVRKNQKPMTKIYNLREENKFEGMEIKNFENHTRAFVKIQDGCNAFCSYCIIPYTRGKIRSKPKHEVINEVTNLVNSGYKEIVLTGIHTGKYGIDLKDTNLEDLLKELIKIKGIYRLRLSSIEINEITEGILDLMKQTDIIANHLHIPLQSGSNKILKLMNRKYTREYFLAKIEKIRKIRKDISITTDLIVGFPNETDEDFQETIDTLNQIKFTKIHTFPYSKRDNTKASQMKNQIDGNIKKRRVKQVLAISQQYEQEYYQKYLFQSLEGVCESKNNKTIVHTTNFIPVILKDYLKDNSIIRVKITKVDKDNKVYGEVEKSNNIY